jgi:hypothetical protein
MAKGDIEVHPQGEYWAVRVEGEPSPRALYDLKADALDHGRGLARQLKVELVVKTAEGRIAEKDSYGHGPSDVAG